MRTLSMFCFGVAMLGMASGWARIGVRGGPTAEGDAAAPEHTTDGNDKTSWAGDPAADEWQLTFDLGKVEAIQMVRVHFVSAVAMARDIRGDISVDGADWQPLGAFPVCTPTDLSVGQPLRFFRLTLSGKLKNGGPRIREVFFVREGEKLEGAGAGSPVREILYPSAADGSLQPARFFAGKGTEPVPLVVGLHTWSADYRQRYLPAIESHCVKNGWVYIHPNFRGPNWTPEATGSELVVGDIVSAVEYACGVAHVDSRRIYLVGGSGGGYHALLMAGRRPGMWAAVSAWVPISDLTAWYHECRVRKSGYADHIVKSCGGAPGSSPAVDRELRGRSPLTHLENARDVPLDINAGIHDGHTGSVPISHSLLAFNAVARAEDRIGGEDIETMTAEAVVPAHLAVPIDDPSYGRKKPLFRRQSGKARITIFEGGHEVVQQAAISWLSQQVKPIEPEE